MKVDERNKVSGTYSARSDVPDPMMTPRAPRSRPSMSCGVGGRSMPVVLAVLVGVAIGALMFGGSGGAASATLVSGGTFLLFLLPCLLMFGAMMAMGNRSGPDEKL